MRWHDLRHTAVTRLLESGQTLPMVASIMGWSASTTARMALRYGHISTDARRAAMEAMIASRGMSGKAPSGSIRLGLRRKARCTSGSADRFCDRTYFISTPKRCLSRTVLRTISGRMTVIQPAESRTASAAKCPNLVIQPCVKISMSTP